MNKVTCFIMDSPYYDVNKTINEFRRNSEAVKYIYVLSNNNNKYEGAETLPIRSFVSTENLKAMLWKIYTSHIMLYTEQTPLKLSPYSIDRMLSVAKDIDAGFVYSDSYQVVEKKLNKIERLDFQRGSIRSDFNFGPILFFSVEAYKDALDRMYTNFKQVALYDLVLKVSEKFPVLRLQEYLYTELAPYFGLNPLHDEKNTEVRNEVDKACSFYLKNIGAWIKPDALDIDYEQDKFPVEASIIIYSKNSEKTIESTINSALSQKANFEYNIIVVDNHSTDGTRNILAQLEKKHDSLIFITPDDNDLEVGGCYNKGISHPKCGRFTIKLDSTDICMDNKVLATIVEAFYEQKCAMLVGAYKTVDANLKEIPPGLVDAREWTIENMRSVLLKPDIGKPRAFFTPIIREIKFPNNSYLEGYAVALAISREYKIGRIYTPLYLCRKEFFKAESQEEINKHNSYVDKIRSIEIEARINKK